MVLDVLSNVLLCISNIGLCLYVNLLNLRIKDLEKEVKENVSKIQS